MWMTLFGSATSPVSHGGRGLLLPAFTCGSDSRLSPFSGGPLFLLASALSVSWTIAWRMQRSSSLASIFTPSHFTSTSNSPTLGV